MLHYIYCRPLGNIIFIMVLLFAVWGVLTSLVPERHWKRGNIVLTILMTAAILYATVLNRTENETQLILTPFASFAAAKQQPECYREMLMNVFLFFPFGLTMSGALPCKWRRSVRIAVTVTIGCLFSVGIECIQYHFALGTAETDDVICNTLGAFIGSASLLLPRIIEKIKEKFGAKS